MNCGKIKILDSDVMITAKNDYYAFDICPGFWEQLLLANNKGVVFSIDEVQEELLKGTPDDLLFQWVNEKVPQGFFLDTTADKYSLAYQEVDLWVNRSPQYTEEAKADFSDGADGWLVAYALADPCTIVSNEQSRPKSKSRIQLPDVCIHFNVPIINTFDFLRQIKAQFVLPSKKSRG